MLVKLISEKKSGNEEKRSIFYIMTNNFLCLKTCIYYWHNEYS